jgi:hypothetical protein
VTHSLFRLAHADHEHLATEHDRLRSVQLGDSTHKDGGTD